jgi:hypothetical protein
MPLNTAPYEWTIRQLWHHIDHGPHTEVSDGGIEPCRPCGLYSLRNRFRLAWMVFKGDADALRWPSQNPKAY